MLESRKKIIFGHITLEDKISFSINYFGCLGTVATVSSVSMIAFSVCRSAPFGW